MPKISFTFTGQVNNAEITTAMDISTMRDIDVSHLTSKELLQKIDDGELALSFPDAYADGGDECTMDDFTIPEED
jgi:hypothetical protein